MISHSHKFIYCRIHKCANSTLRFHFRDYAAAQYFYSGMHLPARLDAALLQIARYIQAYPNYFAFMFVRNPFDRFVSFYQETMRRLAMGWGNSAIYPKDIRECAERVQFLSAQGMMLKVSRKEDPKGYWFCKHALPQNFYLLEGVSESLPKTGVLGSPYSFIGRVERLTEDFRRLEAILKLPQYPLQSHHASPQREIKKGRGRQHYSAYYDKRLRGLVESIYARDLELFGYEFEEPGKVQRIKPLYDMSEARQWRESPPRLRLSQWGGMAKARVQIFSRDSLPEMLIALLRRLSVVKNKLGIRRNFPTVNRLIRFFNEWQQHAR